MSLSDTIINLEKENIHYQLQLNRVSTLVDEMFNQIKAVKGSGLDKGSVLDALEAIRAQLEA